MPGLVLEGTREEENGQVLVGLEPEGQKSKPWECSVVTLMAPRAELGPAPRPHLPCACLQVPHQHLSKTTRTLSTSTQDLGPR